MIESDDASDLSGFATYAPHPVEGDTTCGGWGDENVDFADDDTSDSDTCARPAGAAPEGELDGCRTAGETPTASPRSWGFDVEEINRSYALVIFGGKAMVVNEQPHGPINDRWRMMPFETMNSWFANRVTEIEGPDGKIRAVTWAKGVAPTPRSPPIRWRGILSEPRRGSQHAELSEHLARI